MGTQAGVTSVELLVVLREFVMPVVRRAERFVGALVSAVGQHENLPGESGLDDERPRLNGLPLSASSVTERL